MGKPKLAVALLETFTTSPTEYMAARAETVGLDYAFRVRDSNAVRYWPRPKAKPANAYRCDHQCSFH